MLPSALFVFLSLGDEVPMRWIKTAASLAGTTAFIAIGWAWLYHLGDRQALAVPPLSLEGYMHEVLPDAPAKKTVLKVDNSACYVCHGNYEEESLVLTHGKKKVGCIDCHGTSYAHRNDEDNVTPPDKMFPPDAIDPMCRECHTAHDVPARKVIQRWQERCPQKTDPARLVCTDCHFQHRLRLRTVRWNKKTGQLLIRQEEKPPASAAGRDRASAAEERRSGQQ
ncbi:MAG TPA: hypothetical protein EYH34_06825 [Planctomycetes bacterium]|nr:hypothetical protein [Planctomycetota bacterium]